MAENLSDQARLAAIAVNQAGRMARRLALRTPLSRWVAGVPTAYHLLILPQDLRTGDPSFAVELYDGYFGLAGAVAPTGSESPFSIQPPTPAWQRELYAFSWLRHLHAADDEIARERARKLMRDWIALGRRGPAIAHDVDVTARRVIALLSHATFLLDGADPEFYDDVMRMLSRDTHDLTVIYGEVGHSVAALRALTAVLLAGLCVAEQQAYLTMYQKAFCAELDRQILADGGHVSRDPSALIELLLELFPLKQCFVARQLEPPPALYAALGRMLPMMRFLRLGDGGVARFNGMGPTPLDQIATVLAYDDAGLMYAEAFAPTSGYMRLAQGGTVVMADAGTPPPLAASARATAGCASFEMSVGYEPLIVNCGAPADDSSDWYVVSRSTAAHSTLTIDDLSSSRLIKAQPAMPGGRDVYLLSAPRQVRADIQTSAEGALVAAVAHDGYRDRFGLIHKRRLTLSADGLELDGEDQLAPTSNAAQSNAGRTSYAIRFHLHPRVNATLARNSNSVILTTPSGQAWRFSAPAPDIDVEESIYFADPICLRRSLQIVLKGPCDPQLTVKWKIARDASSRREDVIEEPVLLR
jgi:uncharacterized heparinase superfamily protein